VVTVFTGTPLIHATIAKKGRKNGMNKILKILGTTLKWLKYSAKEFCITKKAENVCVIEKTIEDCITIIMKLPTRVEPISGQNFSYIQRGEAIDSIRALTR
jgi:hypothetical protein